VYKQAWIIKNYRYVWDVSSIPKLNSCSSSSRWVITKERSRSWPCQKKNQVRYALNQTYPCSLWNFYLKYFVPIAKQKYRYVAARCGEILCLLWARGGCVVVLWDRCLGFREDGSDGFVQFDMWNVIPLSREWKPGISDQGVLFISKPKAGFAPVGIHLLLHELDVNRRLTHEWHVVVHAFASSLVGSIVVCGSSYLLLDAQCGSHWSRLRTPGIYRVNTLHRVFTRHHHIAGLLM
jgi:hypothetical protein